MVKNFVCQEKSIYWYYALILHNIQTVFWGLIIFVIHLYPSYFHYYFPSLFFNASKEILKRWVSCISVLSFLSRYSYPFVVHFDNMAQRPLCFEFRDVLFHSRLFLHRFYHFHSFSKLLLSFENTGTAFLDTVSSFC